MASSNGIISVPWVGLPGARKHTYIIQHTEVEPEETTTTTRARKKEGTSKAILLVMGTETLLPTTQPIITHVTASTRYLASPLLDRPAADRYRRVPYHAINKRQPPNPPSNHPHTHARACTASNTETNPNARQTLVKRSRTPVPRAPHAVRYASTTLNKTHGFPP